MNIMKELQRRDVAINQCWIVFPSVIIFCFPGNERLVHADAPRIFDDIIWGAQSTLTRSLDVIEIFVEVPVKRRALLNLL